MGVKTIGLTEKKGGLAGALIVREHQDLVFISQNGMVQRTGVRGISKQGRPAQGVRVMNLREDDQVSAVALVMEDEADRARGRRPRAHRGPGPGRSARAHVDEPDRSDEYAADRPPATAPPPSPASATFVRPGKGGGPNLIDRRFGTLEVSGR